MTDTTKAPRWWHCDTHGPGNATAWGCPECVREMRADLATLRAREKACATMDDAQKVSLVRALQECCVTLGLHAMASPADLVREVAGLRQQMTALLLLEQEVRLIDAHGTTPDGDGVNGPTALWAEDWTRRLGASMAQESKP